MTITSSQKNNSRSQAGFTLVELLIVIVILAILASSIALFSGKTTMNSRLKACQANWQLLDTANSTYEIDKTRFGIDLPSTWNIPTLLSLGYLDLGSSEYSSSLGIFEPTSICPLLLDTGSIYLVNDKNFMIKVDSPDVFLDENSLLLKKTTSRTVEEPTSLNRGQNTIRGTGLNSVDCVELVQAQDWSTSRVFPQSGNDPCPDGVASNSDPSSLTFNDNTARSTVYIFVYFSDGSWWSSKRTYSN